MQAGSRAVQRQRSYVLHANPALQAAPTKRQGPGEHAPAWQLAPAPHLLPPAGRAPGCFGTGPAPPLPQPQMRGRAGGRPAPSASHLGGRPPPAAASRPAAPAAACAAAAGSAAGRAAGLLRACRAEQQNMRQAACGLPLAHIPPSSQGGAAPCRTTQPTSQPAKTERTGPISCCMRIDRRLCVIWPSTTLPAALRGRPSPPPSSSPPSSASEAELGACSANASSRLRRGPTGAGQGRLQ